MGINHATLKSKAIRLRKNGLSYSEIRKRISVPKSTLSFWLKTIPLKEEHRKRLYTKQIQILSRGPESQKERRAHEVKRIIQAAGKEITTPLSFETYRLMGVALYWAEGSKGKCFEITNSDPSLILFMVKWIEKVLGVPPPILKAKLNIYPQQNDRKIKRFWSDLLDIPLENFGKSYIKPISKNYKKNNLYYGTIRIGVPKSADIRYRTFGWVKAALKDIEPQVEKIQRDWKSLKETPRPVNLK